MLEITEIQALSDWLLHRERFDTLAGDYFTRRFAWLSAAWFHCSRPGDRLSILCVCRDQVPIGYLPLFTREHPIRGRCLKFVGSGKPCSDRMGIYVAPEDCAEVSDALAEHLRSSGEQGEWDWLELEGVQMRDACMHRFLRSLRQAFGMGLYEQKHVNCWEVSLPDSWEGYLSQCGKNSRHEFRKLDRDYIKTGRAKRRIADSRSEALQHLNAATQLHQRRRHSIDSTGCLDTDGFEPFLENACGNLIDEKRWFSLLVEIDGKLGGGAVGAFEAGRISIYLVGMEPELAVHKPGKIMNLLAIQYAIEHGCTTFDLMRGDEEYKQRLGCKPCGQYIWRAAAPRVLPRLRGSVLQAGSAVKRWLQTEAFAT